MNTPQIISAVVAVIGVALGGFALWAQRKYEAMRAAKTLNVADLAAVPPGSGPACEIKGVAEPGPAGQLTGPMSGHVCVWFHTKTEERWREYHRDSNGRSRTSTHRRTLQENGSPPSFHVRDQTGVALLDFRGTSVDSPMRSFRRAVPASRRDGFAGLAIEFLSNKRDHEIIYTEVIVAPGQPIYALGKGLPHPETGAPVMAKPDEGPFIVSTRSEEQLSKGAVTRMRIGYIGGGVLFAGGAVALVVTSLVT
jgi:hypothetical protein